MQLFFPDFELPRHTIHVHYTQSCRSRTSFSSFGRCEEVHLFHLGTRIFLVGDEGIDPLRTFLIDPSKLITSNHSLLSFINVEAVFRTFLSTSAFVTESS